MYQASSYARVMIVRFFGPSSAASFAEYIEDLKRAYVAAGSRPLALAVLVGPLKFPDAAQRAAMRAASRESKEMVASTHLAIEGTGVIATMMRTIIDGIAVIMGLARGSMVFYGTSELAIRGACAAAKVPPDPVVLDWNSRSRETSA